MLKNILNTLVGVVISEVEGSLLQQLERVLGLSLLLLLLFRIDEHLSQIECLLHLILVQLSLQLVILLDLVVEHHCYTVKLFLQLFVLLGESRELVLHGGKLSLFLQSTFLGRLSILLEPLSGIEIRQNEL